MLYIISVIICVLTGVLALYLLVKMTLTYHKICECQIKTNEEIGKYNITRLSNIDEAKYMHRYKKERICAIICLAVSMLAGLYNSSLNQSTLSENNQSVTEEGE